MLLDIDRRMCWDFINDNMFVLDLVRPIYPKDHKLKQKRCALKYIDSCYTINCPLMTMYKGFTYKFRIEIEYQKHLHNTNQYRHSKIHI